MSGTDLWGRVTAEGLPGSPKSMACVKRNTRELGRPNWFLAVEVSEADIKTGKLTTSWESDQLIVLRERESRSQGEGADVIRSQQRKH